LKSLPRYDTEGRRAAAARLEQLKVNANAYRESAENAKGNLPMLQRKEALKRKLFLLRDERRALLAELTDELSAEIVGE